MKTAEQWTDHFLEHHGTGHPPDAVAVSKDELRQWVHRIQAEATAHAIRNVPPLPQLRVTDDRAAEMQGRLCGISPAPWVAGLEYDCPDWGENQWAHYISCPETKMVVADVPGEQEERADMLFILHARTDLPDLLADRETLLRLLHDSDGIDAYSKGFAAGLEAVAKQKPESESWGVLDL